MSDTYFYSNSDAAAASRLRALEVIEDETTIEILTSLGVAVGWQCLELGAGAGSIALWLAKQVGSSGCVLATDLDTRHLDPVLYEVQRHDLAQDPLPDRAFDLIHARHVLIHIDCTKHDAVLRSMRNALKPGGLLLLEESDLGVWQPLPSCPDPIHSLFSDGIEATLRAYRSRAMNPTLGAELEQLISRVDLRSVGCVRRSRLVKGCSAEAFFHQVSARQLAESIRLKDPQDAELLQQFARCFDEKELEYSSRATVSVSAVRD